MKVLLKKFSRKAVFQLNPDYFTVEILNERGAVYQNEINLREIKSYSIQFPNEKFNAIKFRLINNQLFEWSFFRIKQYDEDIIGADLIDNFIKLINEYNARASTLNKVVFQPSFYATKTGLFCIIGLFVFFVCAILLFALQSEKSLPVTFVFSSILIFQLILKRKRDLEFYKKMNL
jgi:hypothetical protein